MQSEQSGFAVACTFTLLMVRSKILVFYVGSACAGIGHKVIVSVKTTLNNRAC